MKWFKFYGQDWLTDTKILQMSAEDKLCFITLLCLASSSETGKINNCKEEVILRLSGFELDPYTAPDDLYSKAQGILDRLNDNKMITRDNDGSVTVCNFQKRQGQNLSGYERVKRYRDKQNKAINKDKIKKSLITNDNVNDNTNDNARLDKTRIDKIRERKTPQEIAKDFFEKGPKYEEYLDFFSEGKDKNKVVKEFESFIIYWMCPNKTGTKLKWEGEQYFDVKRRLYTWLNKSFK